MMPSKLLLLSCFLLLPFFATAIEEPAVQTDSIKYRGYRLELTNFKKIKEKSDWLKISFNAINSGRMNVDLGRKGTEHWVVINFDNSIFKAKLGGYRSNIRRQLIKEGFKLDAGKSAINIELKIPNVLPTPPRKKEEPLVSQKEKRPATLNEEAASSLSWSSDDAPSLPGNEFSEKGSGHEAMPVKSKETVEKACPDLFLSNVKIIRQDEKWVTVQYTITNQGKGVFYLFGNNNGEADNLHVNAYLSGVTTLTRGALPIGGKPITAEISRKNELKQGESVTSQIKLDIRKKTRYMKSLILNLESRQFASECDRKNNSKGIVLR